jgi:CRP-like cAMP-binding protein
MEGHNSLSMMLRKLKLWVPLDASDEEALLNLPYSVTTLPTKKTFIAEGDIVVHCWLVLSGFCVRYKLVGDGGRQIVSIHMKGDLVDLQNAIVGMADHSVQTVTACKMAKIPVAAIHAITDTHPRIKDAMWHDTLVDGSIYREWVANVGRRDAHARIAHLLCEFSVKLEAVSLGEQLDYTLPMTQDELADATGLTAVHINRTLMDLARQGLIERVTPRSIVIGDWKRLAAAGDFRPDYLHLGPPKPSSGTH